MYGTYRAHNICRYKPLPAGADAADVIWQCVTEGTFGHTKAAGSLGRSFADLNFAEPEDDTFDDLEAWLGCSDIPGPTGVLSITLFLLCPSPPPLHLHWTVIQ